MCPPAPCFDSLCYCSMSAVSLSASVLASLASGVVPAAPLSSGASSVLSGASCGARLASASASACSIRPRTKSRWVSFTPVRAVSLARWVLMRWKSYSGIWNAIVLLPVMLIPPFSSFIL